MTGPEFRQARINAHLSYRQAARFLLVSVRTVQAWETKDEVPQRALAIKYAPCPTCGTHYGETRLTW